MILINSDVFLLYSAVQAVKRRRASLASTGPISPSTGKRTPARQNSKVKREPHSAATGAKSAAETGSGKRGGVVRGASAVAVKASPRLSHSVGPVRKSRFGRSGPPIDSSSNFQSGDGVYSLGKNSEPSSSIPRRPLSALAAKKAASRARSRAGSSYPAASPQLPTAPETVELVDATQPDEGGAHRDEPTQHRKGHVAPQPPQDGGLHLDPDHPHEPPLPTGVEALSG